MKIALCQLNIRWEDKEANEKRIAYLLKRDLGGKRIDWIIFPEFTLTGFSLNAAKTTLNAEDIEFFRAIAPSRRCFVTFSGILKGRNICLTLDSRGREVSRYAKIHLYSHGGEDKAYRPGNKRAPFKISGFSASPFICYDLRFSCLFWNAALKTDLFVVVANWPAEKMHHWEALLRARAIENQSYVVGINRIGASPTIRYCGSSRVFDPFGQEILDCGAKEGVYCANVERALVRKTRADFPVLADRNPTSWNV